MGQIGAVLPFANCNTESRVSGMEEVYTGEGCWRRRSRRQIAHGGDGVAGRVRGAGYNLKAPVDTPPPTDGGSALMVSQWLPQTERVPIARTR